MGDKSDSRDVISVIDQNVLNALGVGVGVSEGEKTTKPQSGYLASWSRLIKWHLRRQVFTLTWSRILKNSWLPSKPFVL